jgi:hypothetical protein
MALRAVIIILTNQRDVYSNLSYIDAALESVGVFTTRGENRTAMAIWREYISTPNSAWRESHIYCR